MKLSHLDEKNHPKMVDVSDKNITLRIATASGIIYMSQEAFDVIKNNTAKKRSCSSNSYYCGYNGG